MPSEFKITARGDRVQIKSYISLIWGSALGACASFSSCLIASAIGLGVGGGVCGDVGEGLVAKLAGGEPDSFLQLQELRVASKNIATVK